MSEIFNFIGGYWWLVFPLGAVGAGAFRALNEASKQRHKRRLEILAAKRDLRAVAVDARAARRELRQDAKPETPAAREERLKRITADHDELTRRWLDYELDVAKLIAFPTMSDGRNALTAAFLRAKRVADGLRPATTARLPDDAISQYGEAVNDFGVAFDIAEREARRLRDSTFTVDERKRLDRAKQLLQVAVDDGATQAERNIAYRRVREELDGLIVLSDDAIDRLEEQVALQLPTAAAAAGTVAPTAAPVGHQSTRPRDGSAPEPTAGAAEADAPVWPVPSLRERPHER